MEGIVRKAAIFPGLILVMVILVMPTIVKATESITLKPENLEGAPPVFIPHVIFDPLLVFMNGDFESGDAYWTPDLPAGATRPLIYEAGDLPVPPFQGNWMAWFESEGIDGIYMLTQRVTIPADATHLSFWYWDDFGPNCGDGGLIVQTCGQVTYLSLCYSQWWNKMYDVSSCAGQTLDLRIGMDSYGLSYPDTIFLDQIEFVNNSNQ